MTKRLTFDEQDEKIFSDARKLWLLHMWLLRQGSYNGIEAKIQRGKLKPFICPRKTCGCQWTKG